VKLVKLKRSISISVQNVRESNELLSDF